MTKNKFDITFYLEGIHQHIYSIYTKIRISKFAF